MLTIWLHIVSIIKSENHVETEVSQRDGSKGEGAKGAAASLSPRGALLRTDATLQRNSGRTVLLTVLQKLSREFIYVMKPFFAHNIKVPVK